MTDSQRLPPRNGKRKQPHAKSGTAVTSDERHAKRRRLLQITRTISSQSTRAAFPSGELDVSSFVKAREYEIIALEDGIRRSKRGLNERAFQDLPRDMRRRTASHNAKRIPRRLRSRAKKEMAEDNTPIVEARRRKPNPHKRLRLDTAKRLQALSARSKVKAQAKENAKSEEAVTATFSSDVEASADSIKTRKSKAKSNALKHPPLPSAKFRKRQIHKTWLPTHLFHTKRAHLTPPKEPLWRFAIPLSPSMKGFRTTHRASCLRGAVAWDTSYMSTICLEAPESSIQGLLKMLSVGAGNDLESVWGIKGRKWRDGLRAREFWLYERDGWPSKPIGPATIIWCRQSETEQDVEMTDISQPRQPKKRSKRKVFIRIHPSAFLRLWGELIKLSKIQKPPVSLEDLRFEIGSVELIGPASTEALVGVLWPIPPENGEERPPDSPEEVWTKLASVQNPSVLPRDVVVAFTASDPRLHHPPRTVPPSQSSDSHTSLIQLLSTWPLDGTLSPPEIFSRHSRLRAQRALPSQKSINRRKSVATPGQYPKPQPTDPKIPILLYSSPGEDRGMGMWTVLLPWKCVLPVWYSLMHYPLRTGGNISFGGLNEKRQVLFETGRPWFPGDFPGTKSGIEWETVEALKRKSAWEARPKGRRVEYDTLVLGEGRKGEVGLGWGCDWMKLLSMSSRNDSEALKDLGGTIWSQFTHLPPNLVKTLFSSSPPRLPPEVDARFTLLTVKIALISRGAPETCARIYRLPANDPELRRKWLSILPKNCRNGARNEQTSKPKGAQRPVLSKGASPHLVHAHLADSLLNPPLFTPGSELYPCVPGEADLIGFITTGNFNLGEGRASCIGSLLLSKVWPDSIETFDGSKAREKENRLVIIRDAGQKIGRLARWEVA